MKRLGLLLLWILPTAALAATAPEGVEYHVRRGFFAETDVGAFFTVGGRDGYSNAQAFLQLGLGVDLSKALELGVQLGLGSSHVDCFAQGSAVNGSCTQADSFTVAMVDVALSGMVPLWTRVYLTPRVMAGYTSLDPTPVAVSSGRTSYSGVNVGLGVGIEYATSLPHFSVGLDVSGRYVLGANIPGIAILPRLKYTF